jgi:hypothetical protein
MRLFLWNRGMVLTFLERCSVLCSTNIWAENRMVNEGLRLRFECVQGNSVPVLFNKFKQ